MHHDQTVSEIDGLAHRVGDHKHGETVAVDDAAGEFDHLVGAFGVERGRVFIE